MCSSASRHSGFDPRDPEIEQPVEPAQRVRGEDRPRRRRLARRRGAEALKNAVGDDLAPAARQPARDRRRVIGAGHHQGGTVPGEPPQIARLLQIEGGIVQPEHPTPCPADQPDDPVAAIADVEVASSRQVARQWRPAHAFVNDCRAAAIARLDAVTSRRQRLGERCEGSLRAAERRRFRHRSVKGDAVIGHHHRRHHSVSRWPSSVGCCPPSGGSSRAFRYERIG